MQTFKTVIKLDIAAYADTTILLTTVTSNTIPTANLYSKSTKRRLPFSEFQEECKASENVQFGNIPRVRRSMH